MIYYSIISEQLSSSDYEKMYMKLSALLPDFRRKKAESIIPAKERAVSALSFVLLCHALYNEYPHRFPIQNTASICKLINFSYSKNGKPYLSAPYDDIFFNISHCHTAIACAVAPFKIGVDIQDIRHPSPAVLKRFPAAMDDMSFSKLWSRYEAYTKLTGEGITKSLAGCDYMSEMFIKDSNAGIITSPIFYDASCHTVNDTISSNTTNSSNTTISNNIITQKKTAAFLSAAFHNNIQISNSNPPYTQDSLISSDDYMLLNTDDIIYVDLSCLCDIALF
jgi:phosphopantetheinyl transferase